MNLVLASMRPVSSRNSGAIRQEDLMTPTIEPWSRRYGTCFSFAST